MITEKNDKQWTEAPSQWVHGPWMSEPDRARWTTPSGLEGLVLRNSYLGTLCGYVGLPNEHRFWGAHSDNPELRDVQAHGGLTFSGRRVFRDGEDPGTLWYLGFDCGHSGDLIPFGAFRGAYGTYRSFVWVCGDVDRLADQLWLLREPEQGQK
jgi:hypothetical protein